MISLREQDGELIQNWYILALESEVPATKPIRRSLYEKSYALFRNERNEICVILDTCIHRGTKLSEGKVENGRLRCPYHGWVYDGDGCIVEIPSEGPGLEAQQKVSKLGWCQSRPATVVQDGCVWIWTGDAEKKTPVPVWRFPNHGQKQNYFMVTDFGNEVGNLIQNFMDVPHTVFVHSGWFRSRKLLKVPIQIDVGSGRVKVTYKQTKDSIGFTEKIFNPKGEPATHTDEYIFPNITRVDYTFGSRQFIINSQCSPISRYQTRVYTWIAYDVGAMNRMMKPFLQFYTRKVITQDVKIMKNQGDNLQVFTDREFKSTQADELHLAIDRMRNLGVENQQKVESVQFSREREFWI